MSISGISSSATQIGQASSSGSSFRSRMEEGRKAMESLEEALSAGDLTKAKELFESIQKNAPPAPPEGAGRGKGAGGDRESDFAALQEALEAGDVEAAQSAFGTIQSRMKDGREKEQGWSRIDPSFNNDTTGDIGTLLNLIA